MPIRLGASLGTNTGTASSGSIVLTTTADCAPGDLILVFVGIGATSTGETLSVTDSVGNIYTTDVTSVGTTTAGFFIARSIATIALPSGSTITGTLGAASVNRLISAANFTGMDNVIVLDKTTAVSGTDVNWNSGNTLQTTQTHELVIGGSCMFSVTQGTSTPAAGFIELHDFGTTATAMTTTWKVVTVTGIQAVSGTWAGTTSGENRRDGAATYRRAPEGTTTSTSSTSASTFSTSSTSSSISSTSSSISSTSTSVSTSSTSISTSSTSSSISSTSSSTSSTSISSTSSSTSISSTSSSISSTSQSSTSLSSTSSSTSFSSTSSSFSSTSSSQSSTSISTSSTSFSSTSSSSSTSSTTLPPPNLTYSYLDSLVLPFPALIQSTSGTNATGATTSTATSAFGSPNIRGNTILVAIANDGSNKSVSKVADTLGNTYVKVVSSPPGDTVTAEIWAAFNILPGSSNVVTATQASNDGVIFAQEWSGILPSPIDQTSGATGGGASMSTNTPSTSFSSEVVFVAGEMDIVGSNALSVGAGYSNFSTLSSNVIRGAVQSNITTSTGGQSSSMVMTAQGGASWRIAVATFKATYPSSFNILQYSNVSADDGGYFVEFGSEYMIRNYKRQNGNNTDSPTFTWKGRTTYDTRISPILIQIFNVNSSTWETLAVANKVPPDTDFYATVSQTTNASNYYDSTNTVTFRSYQKVI